MSLVFGETVRDCVRVKKNVNMKQKANEEKKILLWLITRYKIAQLLQNISIIKALIEIKIPYTEF